MADTVSFNNKDCKNNLSKINLLKKTFISVYVDEALPDLLVVTYEFGQKIFKGVLLDSTKRNLPCGVANLNPAFNITKNPDDDILYSVNQRFAYTAPNAATKRKNLPYNNRLNKHSKMTVRLRPRQVLCSKCKGICNENSENVSRKRKSSPIPPPPSPKRSIHAPITRSVDRYNNSLKKKQEKVPNRKTLVPKLTKITVQEEEQDGGVNEAENQEKETGNKEETSKKLLRKKRNSSDDLSDQSVENVPQHNSLRTIKISYGPQGEGTVLKIPTPIDNINISSDDAEENVQNNELKAEKAARKAMKRAKKEARRKVLLSGSPLYLGSASPRYAVGSSSPRYTVGSASPRQGLGNNSPRYGIYDMNTLPRRSKHKMKHKKKHKEDKERKNREAEVSSTIQDDSKEQCITQKLSINLKRLNNTYTPCNPSISSDDDNNEVEDERSKQLFKDWTEEMQSFTNVEPLATALGANGCRLSMLDIVWAKMEGQDNVWWPAQICSFIQRPTLKYPEAYVCWYGISLIKGNVSLVKCDDICPYLENFKTCYNKKVPGRYKVAVKQASREAAKKEAGEMEERRLGLRQPLGNSPSHNIIQQVVPPLASPREIDVVS